MVEAAAYDGVPAAALAARTGATRLAVYDSVGSTMDVAHELARAGVPHGTVVLANEQTTARGRERREWLSPRGGVWLTLIARGTDTGTLSVLPLRVGIAAAEALDEFAPERVGLKWPNDLYLSSGKLAGVLTEARWSGEQLEWIAVGVGVNVTAPNGVGAAGLKSGVSRANVVARLVPAVLEAVSVRGELTDAELGAFAARDIARGREISAPVAGIVEGIDSSGALLVRAVHGIELIRSGSMVFAGVAPSLSANR